MSPQIITEVSFNRPQDETDEKNRVVSLLSNKKEIYFSFVLGREIDDTIVLTFPLQELMAKLVLALVEQEVDDDEDPC